MKLSLRNISLVAALLGVGAMLLYTLGVNTAMLRAAVAAFSPSTCYTAAATTSPAYLQPGLATTTVTCFLGNEGARSASVLVYFLASSTNSSITIGVEESQNRIDWYALGPNQVASTSPTIDLDTNGTFSWQFASTSQGGAATTGSTTLRIFDVNPRLENMRVFVAAASTTGALNKDAAVWVKIVPRQDVN